MSDECNQAPGYCLGWADRHEYKDCIECLKQQKYHKDRIKAARETMNYDDCVEVEQEMMR